MAVPDSIADRLVPITVIRNRTVRAAGRRLGPVIVYDWGFDWHGSPREQRSFVLLDDGFQIAQPVVFPPERQGWWYCDLVKVLDHRGVVSVDDMLIDIIVGPPNRPYRILDLHEYAAALDSGALSPADAADGLVRTQRFLDRRLDRHYDDEARVWLDFPPAEVRALMDVAFAADWSTLEG